VDPLLDQVPGSTHALYGDGGYDKWLQFTGKKVTARRATDLM
jgi:hypothetical protein